MPLCGIISSECLGTLPGAWAKQCENVLEVNCREWLWNAAWVSGCRGPAADWKAPQLLAGLHCENSDQVPYQLSWLTPSPSVLDFCQPLLSACSPHHLYPGGVQRVTCDEFYLQSQYDDNSGWSNKQTKQNKIWELFLVNNALRM